MLTHQAIFPVEWRRLESNQCTLIKAFTQEVGRRKASKRFYVCCHYTKLHQVVAAPGIEPGTRPLHGSSSDKAFSLVESRGIEPRLLVCDTSVLPLALRPQSVRPAGIEPAISCMSSKRSAAEL